MAQWNATIASIYEIWNLVPETGIESSCKRCRAHPHRRRSKFSLNWNVCTIYKAWIVDVPYITIPTANVYCVPTRSVKYVNTSIVFSHDTIIASSISSTSPDEWHDQTIWAHITFSIFIYWWYCCGLRYWLKVNLNSFCSLLLRLFALLRFVFLLVFYVLLLASVFSGAKNGENMAFLVGWIDSMPYTYGKRVKSPVKNFLLWRKRRMSQTKTAWIETDSWINC